MTDYGLNFGFRRTLGDASVREGRYRVPKTGDFFQGDLVTIDHANPGFVKKAAANAKMEPGVTGFLIQEFELASIYEPGDVDSHFRGRTRNGYLATIWSGVGIKVWLRNTPDQDRWDGRAITARSVVAASGLAPGDLLAWGGDSWAETGTAANGALQVLVTDGDTYVEAVTVA